MLTDCARYRFQADGRLRRSMETGETELGLPCYLTLTEHCIAVMLMETFDRLTRKEKYVWDVCSAAAYTQPLDPELTSQNTDLRPCEKHQPLFVVSILMSPSLVTLLRSHW